MEIIKNNLKWTKPLSPYRLNEIDGLALHHMDHPTWGLEEAHAEHLKRGWSGFGYGWLVMKDGWVIEGRGFNFGAHTADHNGHLLSVVFQGDYDGKDKEMPDVQFNAGIELVKWLKYKVPTIKVVDGHRHWRPTACPGIYFPLQEMKSLKLRGEKMAISEAKQKALADLQYLQKTGRINSPDYWHNNIVANTTPNLEYLIVGYAKEVRKNESGNA
ncbi:MAG: hypothetical protein GT601_17535 [Acidaminobacter sp.]|uniref:peptidoglycan recognition protein family protein n=1 Tax=Acidaminobacter sp. TaxID=1872102 RepID=UPI001385DA8F|nr:peptidoglycan recognition family protein [Acidaminobacter sp.]MZQ99472.1 hypothetical protein [Acidaminobacter sp.]